MPWLGIGGLWSTLQFKKWSWQMNPSERGKKWAWGLLSWHSREKRDLWLQVHLADSTTVTDREVDRVHFLASRCNYWALKKLSLRASANDDRVCYLSHCCLGPAGGWGLAQACSHHGEHMQKELPFWDSGNAPWCGHSSAQHKSFVSAQSYRQNYLTGAAGLSGRRIGCPGKNTVLLVTTWSILKVLYQYSVN